MWDRVLVLVAWTVLAPGKRTVSSALRIMGLDTISNFTGYHQVLNRARWSPRKIGRRLLRLILDRLAQLRHPQLPRSQFWRFWPEISAETLGSAPGRRL